VPPLSSHDGFALDLDGVIRLGRDPIEGSPEAVGTIRERGAVVFVTNDPRSTREEVAANLTEIGIPAGPDDVITSASATAETLAAEREGATIIAAGRSALGAELARLGVTALEPADGVRADVVVIGGSSDLDSRLLRITHAAVRDGGEFWATNKDPAYPTADGLVPGTGAFVAAVEYSTGVEAHCVGKPHPEIFASVRSHLGAAHPLMVGDSLDADIGGAAGVGMATALVLTGRTTRADLEADLDHQPDHVFDDLAGVARALARGGPRRRIRQ
jgi:glycerol 3-phosphatase-2